MNSERSDGNVVILVRELRGLELRIEVYMRAKGEKHLGFWLGP